MEDWKEAFGEKEYDAIILGTGFKECLLSGLLAVEGKSVLHLDRNTYYGGFSASLDIHQLFEKFKGEEKADAAVLGNLRDYNMDLGPQVHYGCGQLAKARGYSLVCLLRTRLLAIASVPSVSALRILDSP